MKNSGKIEAGRRVRIVTYLPAAAASAIQFDCDERGISVAAGVARIIHHRLDATHGKNCVPAQEKWPSE